MEKDKHFENQTRTINPNSSKVCLKQTKKEELQFQPI